MTGDNTIPASLDALADIREEDRQVQAMSLAICMRNLWVGGVISQDAFFLGAHICAMMHDRGVDQIVGKGESFCQAVLTVNGELYAGPVTRDLGRYVQALQDLHFRGGIINDMHEIPVFNDENARRHFSLSPQLQAGRHFGFRTPIYFRVIPYSKGQILQSANRLLSTKLQGTNLTDVSVQWG